jgi:hypothetical protein
MGEYADDYFRKQVMSKHGFDPGSMYDSGKEPERAQCPICGKRMKKEGLADHKRDAHLSKATGGQP